jgi:hypothetical protein
MGENHAEVEIVPHQLTSLKKAKDGGSSAPASHQWTHRQWPAPYHNADGDVILPCEGWIHQIPNVAFAAPRSKDTGYIVYFRLSTDIQQCESSRAE